MKRPPLNAAQIHQMIADLPSNHILKTSSPDYVAGFVKAALGVYEPKKLTEILKNSFFIPDEGHYWEETYYQRASELSVAWHLKQKEMNDSVRNFLIEKKVNPPKNVDDYYEVWDKGSNAVLGFTKVALEIKCPFEESPAPFPGHITLDTFGRIPQYQETLNNLKETIELGPSGNVILQAKNPDDRMKQCLVLAHEKFLPCPGIDDLNVLFLASGDRDRLNRWHMCLYGGQGLFTQESFEPTDSFSRVDIVVLSNLKYRHQKVRDASAWTLDDVLLLPILNPHGRKNLHTTTIEKGLSAFNHYYSQFASFRTSSGLIVNEHSETQAQIAEVSKVNRFVMQFLTEPERSRFFPV